MNRERLQRSFRLPALLGALVLVLNLAFSGLACHLSQGDSRFQAIEDQILAHSICQTDYSDQAPTDQASSDQAPSDSDEDQSDQTPDCEICLPLFQGAETKSLQLTFFKPALTQGEFAAILAQVQAAKASHKSSRAPPATA